MMKTNMARERRAGSDDRRRAGSEPRPDGMQSFAAAARATFEIIGLFCVVAGTALAVSPGLRASFGQLDDELRRGLAAAEETVPAAAAAEVPVEPRIGQPVTLGAPGNNAAMYLARRYHVADGAMRVVVAAAQSAGKERQVDPLLILAVIAVESSMNPFAQSPVGATGLMQVMPDLHGGKFVEQDGRRGALDPVANIRVGSEILGDLIRRGGSVERGLQLYVGAGNASDDGGYANRVLTEFARLRMAAAGGVNEAIAAALRADAHASEPASMTSSLPGEVPSPATVKPNPA
jgi:soluble lytic murein transglycosylase-like protein